MENEYSNNLYRLVPERIKTVKDVAKILSKIFVIHGESSTYEYLKNYLEKIEIESESETTEEA